jgi:hypothetical protein
MDDITLNLLVFAAFILVGGIIFFLVRRKQAGNEQKIVQLAAERGWKYESIREPLAWGMRLASPGWTLESISRSSGREAGPGSSDISMLTTWHADAPGSTLFLGSRSSPVNLGGFGSMLMQQMLQLALGEEAAGLKEVPVGGEAFRKRYMLWAQNPVDAQQIITPSVMSALLAWKRQPLLIKRTSEGLTIELRGAHLKTTADIQSLVRLGEMLQR